MNEEEEEGEREKTLLRVLYLFSLALLKRQKENKAGNFQSMEKSGTTTRK